LNAGGFDSLLTCYHNLKKNHVDEYLFHPTRLYLFAVRVLFVRGIYDDAIELLYLNIEEFSESDFNWANYEAIGEAYLELRDTTRSVESYEKSLQLNQDNTNATEILEQLYDK
jgi:tetratricopeptide (TPR) repeat protein